MFDDPVGRLIGYKQTKKALEDNLVSRIYLANDCDKKIQGELTNLCSQRSVGICKDYTMEQLGKMCNIDVGAAVVAQLKQL